MEVDDSFSRNTTLNYGVEYCATLAVLGQSENRSNKKREKIAIPAIIWNTNKNPGIPVGYQSTASNAWNGEIAIF